MIHMKQQQPSLYRNVFLEPLLWFMALQIALYVGAELGFGSWIVTVLSQSAAISLALAAPAATAFLLRPDYRKTFRWTGTQAWMA